MNLSKQDLFITVGMSIVVIMMSFLFPAIGLTGSAQNASDIPEFNITKGQADFNRQLPEFPSRPSEGTLTYVNGSESWEDNRQVDLQTGDPRYLLSFFDDDPGPDEQYHANLIKFNSSGSYTSDLNINESESKELTSEDGAYSVGLSNMTVLSNESGNESARVSWEVTEQPSDQTWLGRIPGVGALISGTSQLAAVVGWIGGTIWHFVTLVMVTIANTVLLFANLILYFIDFSWWLTSTYTSIVSGAPTAWASVVVAIPGIVLGFQFTKLIAVGVKLLPFT